MINVETYDVVWGFGDEVINPRPRWDPNEDMQRVSSIYTLLRLYKNPESIQNMTSQQAISVWSTCRTAYLSRCKPFICLGSSKQLYQYAGMVMVWEYNNACVQPTLRKLNWAGCKPKFCHLFWPPDVYFGPPQEPARDACPSPDELTDEFIK